MRTDTFSVFAYKTVYPDNAYSKSWYNNKGQLWKQRDPDGVVTLRKYNNKGELEYTAVDLDQNGVIDFNGKDRIQRVVTDVVAAHGTIVRRTRNYVLPTDSSGTELLVSMSEISTNGLRSWQTVYRDGSTPVTSSSETAYGANGTRTVTSTQPDNSYTISLYSYGRLQSVTRHDNLGVQIGQTTYQYDAHGRQWKITDARNGTTTYGYNDADQVTSVTTPPPGTLGEGPQTTTTHFNTSLRPYQVDQPDGTSVFSDYHPTGLLKKTWGSRTYPVEYTYDYAGRMKTMKTWQDFTGDSGTAVTTWNYDSYRGWLANKRYADSTGPDYTYTDAGRLKTRQWARTGTGGQRILTTYTYGFENDGIADNQHGDLVGVAYDHDPANTPAVAYTHDRRGRQQTAVHKGITTTLTYNDANQVLIEAYAGGLLNGMAVTNAYDSVLRRTAVALDTQTSTLVRYGYDTASRLSTVSNFNAQATYGYLANSPLVGQILFQQNGATRMTTTKAYDFLNRLTSIQNTPALAGQAPWSHAYTYNAANQRTRATLADRSYWRYEYDELGQVKRGARYWSDGTPVAGQQFEYTHDDIGNRTETRAGGDENGLNLRVASYSPDALNQYDSRTVPGAVDVLGIAIATNTVTVNGQSAYRKGEYFRAQLAVANDPNAVWQSVTVATNGVTGASGNVFVPGTPESFMHDADGNLASDGRWAYTWDAENRLLKVESHAGAPAASKRNVEWTYDFKGRRIRQTEYVWNASTLNYDPSTDVKLIYDGWRCLAELNATNNSPLRRYTWGLDLSGTMDGAGGVGGLLWMRPGPPSQFCAYDGNGNVVGLVQGSDGVVSAVYEYDPFGRTLRKTGSMANSQPFRFSTKRANDTTDLVLYEYRAYSSEVGRWLSRDPIGEDGGENIYCMVWNDALNMWDYLGMGCRVDFQCTLVKTGIPSPSLGGMFSQTCSYWCVETNRQQISGFTPLNCDDLPNTKIALPRDRTAFLCGTCAKTLPWVQYFEDADLKIDCSRADCRAGCMLAAIPGLKSKKPAVRAAAIIARQACLDTCNSVCRNP